ncbi:MAG: hypothetical protein KKA65_02520 [Nanoarchaeota archaeon]|nr:hypothetical protein [Nanoarchaeota archaeon]MCG2719282.1 hypothetical protein [Nanoarchaeota archaeon]
MVYSVLIISSKQNPFHYFIRLKARTDYKIRISNYRVIADINNKTIIITLIGHRKKVYDKI